MQIGRIIPGLNSPSLPLYWIKILEGMVLFRGKAKEPVAGGAGGYGCLIHTTNGEAVTSLAVHGATGFLILIIEGTAVLIHHDAIFLQSTEAVTIKLLGKQSCRMAQWVDSIVDNQIMFINLGAQKAGDDF